ncbi:hypothetical protein ACQKKK_18990 [Peribacillus sp. NPDC006672]
MTPQGVEEGRQIQGYGWAGCVLVNETGGLLHKPCMRSLNGPRNK